MLYKLIFMEENYEVRLRDTLEGLIEEWELSDKQLIELYSNGYTKVDNDKIVSINHRNKKYRAMLMNAISNRVNVKVIDGE